MSEQTNVEKRIEAVLNSGIVGVAGRALVAANTAQQSDGQFHLPEGLTMKALVLGPIVAEHPEYLCAPLPGLPKCGVKRAEPDWTRY